MKVIIDGVEHVVNNDVKIIWEDEIFDDANCDLTGDVILTLTHEGIIVDEIYEGEVVATANIILDDIKEMCI